MSIIGCIGFDVWFFETEFACLALATTGIRGGPLPTSSHACMREIDRDTDTAWISSRSVRLIFALVFRIWLQYACGTCESLFGNKNYIVWDVWVQSEAVKKKYRFKRRSCDKSPAEKIFSWAPARFGIYLANSWLSVQLMSWNIWDHPLSWVLLCHKLFVTLHRSYILLNCTPLNYFSI